MSKKMYKIIPIVGWAIFLAISVTLVGPVKEALTQTNFEVVAEGLDNPRRLGFGPDGALYVIEAGEGGNGSCFAGPEGQVCYGNSGAVTRIISGTQSRVVSNLPSIAEENTGNGAIGPHDLLFDGSGNLKVVVGLGANPAVRGTLGSGSENLGYLVEVDVSGMTWTTQVDISAYETTNNPDGGAIDSNPYGLTSVADGYLIADAGANALLHIASADSSITTTAVFSDRLVPNPFGPGDVPMQAVPTVVEVGGDTNYYVGQLTGFPFPVGGANIFTVPAGGGQPNVFRGGFTNIVDMVFAPDGSLYVLEMDANGLLTPTDGSGVISQVFPDGSWKTIVSSGLTAPGGLTLGPDGDLYVTNFGVLANAGQVLQVVNETKIYLPIIAKN